jgi:hypothetical protein
MRLPLFSYSLLFAVVTGFLLLLLTPRSVLAAQSVDLFTTVAFEDGRTEIHQGDDIRFTVVYRNNGDITANVTTMHYYYKRHLFEEFSVPPGCSVEKYKVECIIGPVAAGAEGSFSFNAKLKFGADAGINTMRVDLFSREKDIDPTDNKAYLRYTILRHPKITDRRRYAPQGKTAQQLAIEANSDANDSESVQSNRSFFQSAQAAVVSSDESDQRNAAFAGVDTSELIAELNALTESASAAEQPMVDENANTTAPLSPEPGSIQADIQEPTPEVARRIEQARQAALAASQPAGQAQSDIITEQSPSPVPARTLPMSRVHSGPGTMFLIIFSLTAAMLLRIRFRRKSA